MKHQIWNKEMECMSRKDLEALQLERLKALVDYCDKNSKFYHDRFEKHGITADKIKTLSDIQYIPYTTKDDLRDTYPFGMLSVPQKKIKADIDAGKREEIKQLMFLLPQEKNKGRKLEQSWKQSLSFSTRRLEI